MGEFVDEGDGGLTCDQGIDVHFEDVNASIGKDPGWYVFQSLGKLVRLAAPVRFEPSDDDVDSALPELLRFLEHGEGLSDPGGHAEEDLQYWMGRHWTSGRAAHRGTLDAGTAQRRPFR